MNTEEVKPTNLKFDLLSLIALGFFLTYLLIGYLG